MSSDGIINMMEAEPRDQPIMMDAVTNGFEGFENVLEVSDLDTLEDTAMITEDATISTESVSTEQHTSALTPPATLTNRPPVQLYLSCDYQVLSKYQVIVRQNIELFEAQQCDVDSNAQGRNTPIVLGQVGIRCRHCAYVAPSERTRGATYYPSKLTGLYQAAQNLSVSHLIDGCPYVPEKTRQCLNDLKDQKSAAGGGKKAWADRTHALGVYEDENGLKFASRLDAFAPEHVVPHK
mmetsp:Transcript_17101/g.46908  ORF Transcript_17101/g.46908 Transcript_17101/m.46908 type:complete len:237 (+) Transcript_17101:72-782(+)